ncbi:hypothetical protein D3C85_1534150 [compost metagenome]
MIDKIANAKACAVEDVFLLSCLFTVVCVFFAAYKIFDTKKTLPFWKGFFQKSMFLKGLFKLSFGV